MSRVYGANAESNRVNIAPELSFAATEAYKALRTNIMFSLPGENGCRVIGVTSSWQTEGKSTTVVNLANAMAETGHSILVMEADMRRPVLGDRLQLRPAPGLSNLLAGLADLSDVLQTTGGPHPVSVMTAGDIPPNPSELLGSEKMKLVMGELQQQFQYILLDLPPVTMVTDAVIASRLTDGILIVVRENVARRPVLAEAIRQMSYAEAKLLGFVLNDDVSQVKKGRYGKYGGQGYYRSDG